MAEFEVGDSIEVFQDRNGIANRKGTVTKVNEKERTVTCTILPPNGGEVRKNVILKFSEIKKI